MTTRAKRLGMSTLALAILVPLGVGVNAFADTEPDADGSTVNVSAPQANGTQTTGDEKHIPLGVSQVDTSNLKNEVSWYPEFEITLDSHYSHLKFDSQDGKYELLEYHSADFGNDGLPGTEDDQEGWKVKFVQTEPLTLSSDPTQQTVVDWDGENSPLLGKIPGHVEAGTTVNVSTSVNAEQLPGDISDDNIADGTITVDNAEKVSQSTWSNTPKVRSGNEISWGVSWDNRTEEDQGEMEIVNVFPYNGDQHGSSMSQNLPTPRFNVKNVDPDVVIEVTTMDPSTLDQYDDVSDSGASWARINHATGAPIGFPGFGSISAMRITDPNVEAGKTQNIEFYVPEGGLYLEENDVMYNSLRESTVESLAESIPATSPVSTEVYSPSISGQVFYDINQNGRKDENETGLFSNVELLLRDSDGYNVGTTLTGSNGEYTFINDIETDENYSIEIFDRGSTIPDSWNLTTPTILEAPITLGTLHSTHNDFGLWGENASGIELNTTIQDYDGSAPIPNGETKTVFFTLTNTGETSLTDISLTNDVLGDIECMNAIPTLQPGESFECSAEVDIEATEIFEDQTGTFRNFSIPSATTIGYAPGKGNCPASSSTMCASGRTITDMGFDKEGNLVAGYGEWDHNIDTNGTERVTLSRIDTRTGRTVGNPVNSGTEAMSKIINIEGDLYVPMTDPSGKAGYKQTTSNVSGAWVHDGTDWDLLKPEETMVHTFDVEKKGDTIFLAGSVYENNGSAVILAGNNEEGFERLYIDTGGNSLARVYNLVIHEENLYFNVRNAGNNGNFKYNLETGQVTKIFSGVTGDKDKYQIFDDRPITFNTYLIYDVSNGQYTYFNTPNIRDGYVADDGKLYLVSEYGTIYVKDSWDSETRLLMNSPVKAGYNPSSIAIKGKEIYLGHHDGKVTVVPMN